ncbi:MAG: MurR/RpiR family transcriptional regulator [Sphaerochaetaceae bacterium]|nr:MurR/RpiR family transcriptional regulator [Spirochaetales bacterium]MDY5499416.1 MurR/RpiR family transcriptional regulator [Sphaerochaetaceae bacterium]
MALDLIREIERQIPEMNEAPRKVAEYILNDSMEASFSTIDRIAHAAKVSTASVIRLANSLGYKTFREFQKALKEYLRTYSAPINKLSLNDSSNTVDANEDGVVVGVYRQELENMNGVLQTLNENIVDDVAKRLEGARAIYICGVRTSESVARYLSFNLGRMFLNATYVGEAHAEQIEFFKRVGPEDVLIAITVSRYNRTVCDAAAFCKGHGVPVIAITDSLDSPLVPFSVHQLIAKCKSNAFHNSIGAQVFLCDILIKACSKINADRVRKNLKQDESIINQMRYFIRK